MAAGLGTIAPADGYVTAGAVHEADVNAVGAVVVDDVIAEIMPENYPSFMFLQKMRSVPGEWGKDGKLYHYQRKKLPRSFVQVTDNVAAATTTWDVDHGEYVQRNVIYQNRRTTEQVIFREVASGDTVVGAQRGRGSTAAAVILAGDVWERLDGVSAEGQKMMDQFFIKPEEIWNYFNTQRISVGITGHAALMKLVTNGNINSLDAELREKMEIFAVDANTRFLRGQRHTGTYDSSAATAIGTFGAATAAKDWQGDGIIEQMEANATAEHCLSLNGAVDEATLLDDIIEPWVYRAGVGNQLIGLSCKYIMQCLSRSKIKRLEVRNPDKMFNWELAVYEVNGKAVTFMYEPALDPPPSGTGHDAGSFLGLDLTPKHSPYVSRIMPTTVVPVTLADGAHAKASEIMGIWTVIAKDPNNHMFVDKITGFAA